MEISIYATLSSLIVCTIICLITQKKKIETLERIIKVEVTETIKLEKEINHLRYNLSDIQTKYDNIKSKYKKLEREFDDYKDQRPSTSKTEYVYVGDSDSDEHKIIVKALKKLTMTSHPDTGGDNEEFMKVKAVWDKYRNTVPKKKEEPKQNTDWNNSGNRRNDNCNPFSGFDFYSFFNQGGNRRW